MAVAGSTMTSRARQLHIHAGEHAGAERLVGVGQRGAGAEVAGGAADARVDGLDTAAELAVRKGIEADLDLEAGLKVR
jgi:hypothetical protein